MRAVLLRSLAVLGVGGVVLAGVLFVASTVDARPPEVLEIRLTQSLADDSTVALITTSLEVVFSEPVREETAIEAFELEPEIAGGVSWSGSSMIFTPNDPLDLESQYVATVRSGVIDLAGNEMSELPPAFEFQTAGRPQLVDADPGDGADDVALDAPISLTFSTLMDTASVEAELRLRPAFGHDLRWSGRLLEIVPTDPLRPGLEYEVSIGADASDVAGVALDDPISLTFRTSAPGLAADVLVPADAIAGIAPTSPIAIIFDRAIDPDSVTAEALTIAPEVAGTLEVVAHPDDAPTDDGSGRILRFTPSGAMPANTTFAVELSAEISAMAGGRLATPLAWSFTTGAPQGTISNQVTFLTDRAGVTNVWAMNPDGTGQHQLSTSLTPVLDYAIAPDGSSLVTSDGRRLVYSQPDGTDRRTLTEAGLLEFDPAYAPDAQRIAFARADAATGEGLGLWEWQIGGGEPTPIELPAEIGAGPAPSEGDRLALRAPRYSPDGQALAFVDITGWAGLLELPSERLTRVEFSATAAPVWMPDSATLLLTGVPSDVASDATVTAPVSPLTPESGHAVHRLARSGTAVSLAGLDAGAALLAVSGDGTVAYTDVRGSLHIDELPAPASSEPVVDDERVVAGTFAPGLPTMVVILADDGPTGRVELLDLRTGTLTQLAAEGSRPRWLP